MLFDTEGKPKEAREARERADHARERLQQAIRELEHAERLTDRRPEAD